ncbi:MAG: hypothetical protein WD767_08955 [Alphaproteobacteria bacterium]
MALTVCWRSSADIKKQATEDGATGTKNYGQDEYEPVQRIQWSKLVRLRIAEQHPEKKWFKRGIEWGRFKDQDGNEPTQDGSDYIDMKKAVDPIFD